MRATFSLLFPPEAPAVWVPKSRATFTASSTWAVACLIWFSSTLCVFEAGAFFQSKKWEVGLSAQPVFATQLKEKGNGTFGLKPVQHFLIYAANSLSVGENLTLKPSVLVKSDLKETQVEVSAMARWRENTFAGASLRGFGKSSKDAAVLFVGFKLNEKTTLAYAFDIPLSSLNTAQRGSHELLLRYSLNKPIGVGRLPPVIYNPRFFWKV